MVGGIAGWLERHQLMLVAFAALVLAGVIALTASIGFIDGQREIDRETPTRGTITLVGARTNIAAGTLHSKPRVGKPDDPAYLVMINRGDISTAVLVDASTGRVLLS